MACGSGNSPTPLAELFVAAYKLPVLGAAGMTAQRSQERQQQAGAYLVPAQVWPLQGLPKGTAALSPVLRDALARPEAGARLLVHAAAATARPGEGRGSNGGTEGSSSHAEQRCAAVYVRLCRRQGPAGDPVPVLLPPHSEAAPGSSKDGPATEGPTDTAGSRAAPASPGAQLSPAMRGKAGSPAALSPALRGAAAPPVALSPAMRAGAAPPVALGPAGRAGSSSVGSPAVSARGRAASAASPSSSAARPPTPSASSASSGSTRAVAAAARVEDRAKAEALLGTLLAEGERSQGRLCQ